MRRIHNNWKPALAACVAAFVAFWLCAPAAEPAPESESGGMLDFDLGSRLQRLQVSGQGEYSDDEIELSADSFGVTNGIFRAQSNGGPAVRLVAKNSNLTFQGDDFEYFFEENRITLTGRARIIQKNEPGENKLDLRGHRIVILMPNENVMRVRVHRSSEPGGEPARLILKNFEGAAPAN